MNGGREEVQHNTHLHGIGWVRRILVAVLRDEKHRCRRGKRSLDAVGCESKCRGRRDRRERRPCRRTPGTTHQHFPLSTHAHSIQPAPQCRAPEVRALTTRAEAHGTDTVQPMLATDHSAVLGTWRALERVSDWGSKRNHDSLKRSTQILQLSLSDCWRLTTRPPSLDFTAGTGHASDDHSQSHHTNAGGASLVCVCVCVIIGCRVFPRWSERRRRVPIEHRICSRAQLGEEGRPVGPPAAARAAAAPEGAVEHARAVTTIGGLLQPRASLSGVTVRIAHPLLPKERARTSGVLLH